MTDPISVLVNLNNAMHLTDQTSKFDFFAVFDGHDDEECGGVMWYSSSYRK